MKRVSCRAIIFEGDKVATMYRVRDKRKFYTFPGGEKENGETYEQCVVREVMEELGIVVRPIKEVYVYETNGAEQHFFLCEWVSGTFGTGQGEEYTQYICEENYFEPRMVALEKSKQLVLYPPEVRKQLHVDIEKNGRSIRDEVLFLKGKIVPPRIRKGKKQGTKLKSSNNKKK